MRRVLIAIVFVAAAGCGNGASATLDDLESNAQEMLDTDELEGELMTQIESQIDSTKVTVDCPADVVLEEGGTFECSGEDASGATFTVQVSQSDDQGNVTWEVTDASA